MGRLGTDYERAGIFGWIVIVLFVLFLSYHPLWVAVSLLALVFLFDKHGLASLALERLMFT